MLSTRLLNGLRKMDIDAKLKAWADWALCSAYYEELRALVAKYREAAAGLGSNMETGEAQARLYTLGGNDDGTLAEHDTILIWTDWAVGPGSIYRPDYRMSCGHTDMVSAFEDDRATRIGLEGKVVFERDAPGGEWRVAETEGTSK